MSLPCTILLAEDDENDVFFLRRAFREAGITNPMAVTRNGQEAIDYLSGSAKLPNEKNPIPCLMILDLKMPVKTGMDVLEWLREQTDLSGLPVIILSSSAQPHDIDRAYRLGVNAFVSKPSSVEDRLAMAQAINNFWLKFNETPRFETGEDPH